MAEDEELKKQISAALDNDHADNLASAKTAKLQGGGS
jgi:hypothetical protein